MFDSHARSLINDVPEFDGLTGDDVARALSTTYLSIIRYRVNQSDADAEQLTAAQPFLRRVANVLIFHVLLDDERDIEERRSAAFVAAEAIALLADYVALLDSTDEEEQSTPDHTGERQTRIEASLMYLFSGYDACAAGVLQLPPPESVPDDPLIDQARAWTFDRIERLCRLTLVPEIDAEVTFELNAAADLNALELEADTIARLFVELGTTAAEFAAWLGGDANGLDSATARIARVIETLTPAGQDTLTEAGPPVGHSYANVFHLGVLLQLCMPSMGERSLLQAVPAPPNGDAEVYRNYLQARATGNATTQGRPVLWPSAYEYIKECIHGDKRHAVVSMPTGSGKSFIGELAVSQAVTDGWALYLAPTNALTEQIRGDLRTGLRRVLGTEVLAFIGDQEYSIFANDSVSMMESNSVAVMTPEKCALALRLSPEAFENCRLVVFDECHLIGDTGSTRGPIAELVLSQLMLRAPASRFLLMSAIIQNPEDLASWLEESAGGTAGAVSIRWRPTRTMRAILGVEFRAYRQNATAAKRELESLREGRKNVRFNTPCALAAGLQGAWQTVDQPDYVVTTIDCDASLGVSRKKERDGSWLYSPNTDSWVNATATTLARRFAERGIQTLVFTPASKHYPFSNGDKVGLPDQVIDKLPESLDIVDFCRVLAEFEFGCDSHVFSLLDRGIAVHTALMLETEKIASESMFRNRSAPIMFATGTLAQGLNLPAIAVVIAGSRIGDSRGEDPQVVQRRRFSQLLNAAGRAGRAGFANQGIVIAVPDNAVAFRNFDSVLSARNQADYLQQRDDSVQVESGLMNFMDAICNSSLQTDRANDLELEVISLLAGGDENQLRARSVLRRTFAAYIRRRSGLGNVTEANASALDEMRKTFVENASAPDWLTIAAQRAGLDFFLTLAISRSWSRIRPEIDFDVSAWSVRDWLDEFLRLVVHIPPGLLARHLPSGRLERISAEFKNLAKRRLEVFRERSLDWSPFEEWESAWQSSLPLLIAWMSGKPIAEIASLMTGDELVSITPVRNEGKKPIPKALALTSDTWSALSLVAGGFLSVAEQLLDGAVPMALASLPMCIKYGCDTPGTLGWFRFGVRLRRPAHLLAARFPPPADLDDEQLNNWVRATRRDWLNSDVDDGVEFAAIRGFLTQ
jgi:hypothetical protein